MKRVWGIIVLALVLVFILPLASAQPSPTIWSNYVYGPQPPNPDDYWDVTLTASAASFIQWHRDNGYCVDTASDGYTLDWRFYIKIGGGAPAGIGSMTYMPACDATTFHFSGTEQVTCVLPRFYSGANPLWFAVDIRFVNDDFTPRGCLLQSIGYGDPNGWGYDSFCKLDDTGPAPAGTNGQVMQVLPAPSHTCDNTERYGCLVSQTPNHNNCNIPNAGSPDCGNEIPNNNCNDGNDNDCDGDADCDDGDCSGDPACAPTCGDFICESGNGECTMGCGNIDCDCSDCGGDPFCSFFGLDPYCSGTSCVECTAATDDTACNFNATCTDSCSGNVMTINNPMIPTACVGNSCTASTCSGPTLLTCVNASACSAQSCGGSNDNYCHKEFTGAEIWEDWATVTAETEQCTDGWDNDCDGATDCDDTECNGIHPACIFCGNGDCDGADTCATCPGDCNACPPPPGPLCGNGGIDAGETCENCPGDVGPCVPPPTCGNGDCVGDGETCATCPADCGGACPSSPVCGNALQEVGEACDDGTFGNGPCNAPCSITCTNNACVFCPNTFCDGGETCADCPGDCAACPSAPGPLCGNGLIDAGETCGNCPGDVGICPIPPPPPTCGNGICVADGEDCTTCAADCGACPAGAVCGNALQEGGEQCDLGNFGNGACPSLCSVACTDNTCWVPGDGSCDAPFGENCGNSPADCVCATEACPADVCVSPNLANYNDTCTIPCAGVACDITCLPCAPANTGTCDLANQCTTQLCGAGAGTPYVCHDPVSAGDGWTFQAQATVFAAGENCADTYDNNCNLDVDCNDVLCQIGNWNACDSFFRTPTGNCARTPDPFNSCNLASDDTCGQEIACPSENCCIDAVDNDCDANEDSADDDCALTFQMAPQNVCPGSTVDVTISTPSATGIFTGGLDIYVYLGDTCGAPGSEFCIVSDPAGAATASCDSPFAAPLGVGVFNYTACVGNNNITAQLQTDPLSISGTANVRGNIIDEYGNPLDGAQVTAYYPPIYAATPGYANIAQNILSNSTGGYNLPTHTGNFVVKISKRGYFTEEFNVNLACNGLDLRPNIDLKQGFCNDQCFNWENRCNSACDGRQFVDSVGQVTSCNFADTRAQQICNGKEHGTWAVYNQSNSTFYYIDCCEGIPFPVDKPVATISGEIEELYKRERILVDQNTKQPVKLVVNVWPARE